MGLSRKERKLVKEARDNVARILSEDWGDIRIEKRKELQERYELYTSMLKRSWCFSPDALLQVGGSILSIMMILNFEKMDILRSKAVGFILKGRL